MQFLREIYNERNYLLFMEQVHLKEHLRDQFPLSLGYLMGGLLNTSSKSIILSEILNITFSLNIGKEIIFKAY